MDSVLDPLFGQRIVLCFLSMQPLHKLDGARLACLPSRIYRVPWPSYITSLLRTAVGEQMDKLKYASYVQCAVRYTVVVVLKKCLSVGLTQRTCSFSVESHNDYPLKARMSPFLIDWVARHLDTAHSDHFCKARASLHMTGTLRTHQDKDIRKKGKCQQATIRDFSNFKSKNSRVT